ncbi:MAG TPA: P1 family peptidase [Actinomycetota bacterium]|nr:P1 family peptidase [Actinomycetota bacterium]
MGPRARDLGVVIGRLGPGPHNAITDVDGVSVGHATVVRDEPSVARTGVTAIWPHPRDPWRERVYAGTSIVNGYGELIGIDQINEWGLLHSPVVITSSLAIGMAYDATARWIAEREPAQGRSDVIMPVVTECDDSFLNDARAFPLSPADVVAALDGASRGDVPEGCVGAGTGMQCFDFKGGIGTASRVVADAAGDLTVGVLVCTNFGARPDLTIAGVPVGLALTDLMPEGHAAGSCIVVVATDAPMLPHQLRRLALRSGLGLARCGSIGANGSGELMLAFSTAQTVPRAAPGSRIRAEALLDGAFWHEPSAFDPIFTATIEATEEAVVNALFAAETTTGRDGNVLHALPGDRVLEMLDRAGRIE